jgi:hypothetical protein
VPDAVQYLPHECGHIPVTSDQLRPWRLVAGDLSLDFANTLGGRDFRVGPDQASRVFDESFLNYGDLLDECMAAP